VFRLGRAGPYVSRASVEFYASKRWFGRQPNIHIQIVEIATHEARGKPQSSGSTERGRPCHLHRRIDLNGRAKADASAKAEGARGGGFEMALGECGDELLSTTLNILPVDEPSLPA